MSQKSRRRKFMQIQYIDKIFDCSVSRGQVRMVQLRKKTVEFPMVQHIAEIVCVAVAMRDSSHRASKLKGSSI